MADEYPSGYPTPPASPKKSLPAQASEGSIRDQVAFPKNSESLSANDLAMQTKGPINNKATTEASISADLAGRRAREAKRQKATDKDMARPYTTGRSLSR
jgi:hypothetical protein